MEVKSVFILKANPSSLKCGGGIKMWMCVERESYLRFGKRIRMRKEKILWGKKDAKRVVCMAMLKRRKMLFGLVVLWSSESKCGWSKENLEGA